MIDMVEWQKSLVASRINLEAIARAEWRREFLCLQSGGYRHFVSSQFASIHPAGELLGHVKKASGGGGEVG